MKNEKTHLKLSTLSILLTVLLCGASLMIYELAGPRALSPYLGSSIYIWSSIIGVVMSGLFIGYRIGGTLADRFPRWNILAIIISFSAALIIFSTPYNNRIIAEIYANIPQVKLAAFCASFLLFLPVSILLGTVAPFAVRVTIKKPQEAGSTAGTLYAISTFGSVIGTFSAGFWLLPTFGTHAVFYLVAILLSLASSLLISVFGERKILLFIPLLLLLFAVKGIVWTPENPNILLDTDTKYNRVVIYDAPDPWGSEHTVRFFKVNNEYSAMIYLDSDSIVNNYLKFYDVGNHFVKQPKKALMLGGSACIYPRHFLRNFPESNICIIEIDEELTTIAQDYFRLEEDPRMHFIYDDARNYINHSTEKYDIIYGDVFRSMFAAPHQLTTVEAVSKISSMLNPEGAFLVNIISNLDMERNDFLKAELRTFKQVFPQVMLFAVEGFEDKEQYQNFILVGLKSDKAFTLKSNNLYINKMFGHLVRDTIELNIPILTDDFAPVEYYADKIIN